MNVKTVESMDKRRYNLLLWQTVSFAIFWPILIVGPYVGDGMAKIVLYSNEGMWIIIFVVATFKLKLLESRISRDPQLNRALNNEMHRFYAYRSVAWGFWLAMGAAFILFYAVRFFHAPIPASEVCLGVMYVGILALKAVQLILNR